jgi:hypothetical protein
VSLRAVLHRPDFLRDGEAIFQCIEEIASTGEERRFRNDTNKMARLCKHPEEIEAGY